MDRYSEYKDSGIEWIGEIPRDWEVNKFRYLFDLITDKTEDDLPKIGLENIESESGKSIKTDADFNGDGIRFSPGDILFGKLRPYLTKVWLADFHGKAIGDFFVFRPKSEIYDRFGAKLILSKGFIGVTDSSTFGAKMPRVSWEFISNLLIAYPNKEEQTQIAQYLDRKTSRIDSLIEKAKRKIELLKEQRTALINQCVTKGLDPNVETQRLKWVFSSCKNGAWGAEADGETDVVCIRAANFDGRLGRLNNKERTLRSVAPDVYEKLALRRGDIILEKSGGGEKQPVGRAAVYDGNEPSITSNFLARCRPAPGMESAFVNYLLLAIYNGGGGAPSHI